jgi:hypothetical protein
MKSSVWFTRILMLAALSFTAVSVLAQGNVNNNYEPEVGQEGKDVVWVPTPQKLVDTMLELAKLTPGDYLMDLGSGDGRTVISAAKIGARALGVEYNPDMVNLSKKNAEEMGVSAKAKFIQADLYETDFSEATVITMFLLPEINVKLRPKILDLKPGTRIVSNTFEMGDWDADSIVTLEEGNYGWNKALLWIVPAKVEGTWKLGQGGELKLSQKFQMVYGTLLTGNNTITITDGKLNGDQLTFRVNNSLYKGIVSGKRILGTVTDVSRGSKSDWFATLK